ncbi:MAG TPA: hypothetical protein VFC59_08795 [Cryobacterium sp.]|nr:hypothetical protein [Cryobacterium sp.]
MQLGSDSGGIGSAVGRAGIGCSSIRSAGVGSSGGVGGGVGGGVDRRK